MSEVRRRTPSIYPLIWQAYARPFDLFYDNEAIYSATGIQQGDPFGPGLFSLGIDPRARRVHSEFNMWYLDDASFGDEPVKVLADLQNIIAQLTDIGLEINVGKLVRVDHLNHALLDDCQLTEAIIKAVLPDIKIVLINDCTFLDAPISPRPSPKAITHTKHLCCSKTVSPCLRSCISCMHLPPT